MPSKNMLPKGKRRVTVKHEYRAQRGADPPPPPPEVPVLDIEDAEDGIRSFLADKTAAGMRLDQYLAKAIPDISARARADDDREWPGARERRRRQV